MQNGNHAEAPLNPGLVFEMVQAVQKTAALKAAIDLDIFRAVGQGPGDVASIAKHAQASERGIRILCDFLVINGVLAKEGNRYKHTPNSAAFLDPASPACMASVAHFMARPELISGLTGLADVVRAGRTHLPGEGSVEPENPLWVEFAEKMAPMMGPMAGPLGAVVLEGHEGPMQRAGYCGGAWTFRDRDCETEQAGAGDWAGLGSGVARGAEERGEGGCARSLQHAARKRVRCGFWRAVRCGAADKLSASLRQADLRGIVEEGAFVTKAGGTRGNAGVCAERRSRFAANACGFCDDDADNDGVGRCVHIQRVERDV